MSRDITLKRIAREAGVSIATASRAIRQPEVVSEETRARVLRLVEAYGYVPDAAAASFSSRRSGVIGLVVPTISNSIYAAFTEAVQARLQESGRKLLIASTGYSSEVERDIIIFKLVESRAESVILTGYARDAQLYDLLRRYEIPFVISWSTSPDPDVPSISFDNYAASLDAVERLLSLGHRRIALICGVTAVNDRARQRLAAYRAAIERSGIAFDETLVLERPFEAAEGSIALERILNFPDPRRRCSAPTTSWPWGPCSHASGAVSACRRICPSLGSTTCRSRRPHGPPSRPSGCRPRIWVAWWRKGSFRRSTAAKPSDHRSSARNSKAGKARVGLRGREGS